MPLPVQLLPALASHERARGFKVFLVKGLLSSVVRALDGIKTKLAMNPYNPFRKYPFASFFEHREYEEYMDRRKLKKNLKDSISTYRRY